MASRVRVCDVYHVVSCSLHAFCWIFYTCMSQMVLLVQTRVSVQPELLCLRKHLPTIVGLSVRKKDNFYRTLSISAQSVRRSAGFCHDCYRSKGEDLTVIALHTCNYMHFCGQPSYVIRSQRLNFKCNIIFWCCTYWTI